ncbi:MAG TPA: 4Fe-4S binding protein [Candidatus Cloacimonadota bacterium]|nr:4Fe-4S binding protein [Candidatus Cloacimonadota bacterium]
MKNKKMLLCVLLLPLILPIQAQQAELTTYSGKLKSVDNEWHINIGENTYRLILAPDEFLAGKDVTLEAENEILLLGSMNDDNTIEVYNLTYNEKELSLRDESGNILWEEIAESVHYQVDSKKCIGCRMCIKSCPSEAITMVKGKAVIDADKCIGCGLCSTGDGQKFKGCPTKAISPAE